MAATTLAPRLLGQASEWLRERLSAGPVTASALYADAEAAGHSIKTIRRAAIDVGVVKNPAGGGKGCRWCLPQHATKPVEVEEGERACSRCGVVAPLESFPKYGRGKRGWRCISCYRERRRSYERAIANGGERAYERELADPAPDPAPAQRLREELAAARTTGQSFEVAWPAAVDAALALEEPSEATDWRRAFHELRSAWSAGYNRSEVPGGDLPSLLLMAA